MKTTTTKLSWDNAQTLNKLCADLSIERQVKINQDQSIRFLLQFYNLNKGGIIKK